MRSARISFIAATVFLLLSVLILPVRAWEADGIRDDRSRVLFVGESTTTHLRSRGVLPAEQILTTRTGTMMLTPHILATLVEEPMTGREMPLSEAIALRRPDVLVLSFGLNGIVGFLRDEQTYTAPYRKMIREIRDLCPDTAVVLQTVYPVAEHPDPWNFSASPEQINRGIDRLNRLLPGIAEAEGATVADAASALRDGRGFLREAFSADGIHLTREGYLAVLERLGTEINQ